MLNGTWRTRDIKLGDVSVPYHFGISCLDRIAWSIGQLRADSFFIVTDDTVRDLYGDDIIPLLEQYAPVQILSASPGEGMKSMPTLTRHLERAIDGGASRSSVVVAFGGGAPGNLGGLVAALLFRGVRFVHIPTTMVSAMDSVLSFKQAVNSSRGKNHFGVYHFPEGVYADMHLLSTLPDRELCSGLGEAAKNCLAIRPQSLSKLFAILACTDRAEPSNLMWLVNESIDVKSSVTVNDSKERRRGLVLEYGHTVGHAIELCDFRERGAGGIAHGMAVAIGMMVAAHVSASLGGLSAEEVATHEAVIQALGVPLELPFGVTVQGVLQLLLADHKRGLIRTGPDEVPFVLLQSLGIPQGHPDCPLVPVSRSLVREILADLTSKEGCQGIV